MVDLLQWEALIMQISMNLLSKAKIQDVHHKLSLLWDQFYANLWSASLILKACPWLHEVCWCFDTLIYFMKCLFLCDFLAEPMLHQEFLWHFFNCYTECQHLDWFVHHRVLSYSFNMVATMGVVECAVHIFPFLIILNTVLLRLLSNFCSPYCYLLISEMWDNNSLFRFGIHW